MQCVICLGHKKKRHRPDGVKRLEKTKIIKEKEISKMKKIVAMVMVLAMMLALGTTAFAAGRTLTEEEAKQAALAYAGVNAADASFTRVVRDWDNGREVYEVEFYANGTEYDMDVDVNTGTVSDFSTEYHGGNSGRGGYDNDPHDYDDWDDWYEHDDDWYDDDDDHYNPYDDWDYIFDHDCNPFDWDD